MTLTINDTTMTSDQTGHTARQAHGPQYGWEVSWLPGQILDRNTAITAMILADIAGEPDLHEGHRLWPHIQSWAAELGLSGADALTRATQPPPQPPASPNHPGGNPTGRPPTDQPGTTPRPPRAALPSRNRRFRHGSRRRQSTAQTCSRTAATGYPRTGRSRTCPCTSA